MSKIWFDPKPGYDGPVIILLCGRHTKDGRFIPRNVKLTKISRLSEKSQRGIPMVGNPSTNERKIYEMHMRDKQSRQSNDR